MNRQLVLVLIDSLKLEPEDSVFPVVRALAEEGAAVGIVDRADPNNGHIYDPSEPFGPDALIHYRHVDSNYRYETRLEGLGRICRLANADLIWVRIPHPVPPGLFERLALLRGPGTVINHPHGMLHYMDKRSLVALGEVLEDHLPRITVARSLEDIDVFHGDIGGALVVKEPVSSGGQGVHLIDGHALDDPTRRASLLEILRRHQEALCMEFLSPGVGRQTDNRVLVFNGEILGSLGRHNACDWRHNICCGATIEEAEITPEECEIVERLDPFLRTEGISYYGLDTLLASDGRRKLSEINVVDVGGLAEFEALTGRPVSATLARLMLRV